MKSTRISAVYGNLTSMFNGISAKTSLSCSINCCDKEPISNEQENSIDVSIGKDEYISLACSLTESKLEDRKVELQKEVFSKVKNTKEIETGFIFFFPYDERFLIKIAEYIITEKKCCPFFIFKIKLNLTNDILLEITGPLEAKKMLEMFLTKKIENYGII